MGGSFARLNACRRPKAATAVQWDSAREIAVLQHPFCDCCGARWFVAPAPPPLLVRPCSPRAHVARARV